MSGTIERAPATRVIDDTPLLQLQHPRGHTATAASRWASGNISLECVSISVSVHTHAQGQKEKEQHLGRDVGLPEIAYFGRNRITGRNTGVDSKRR